MRLSIPRTCGRRLPRVSSVVLGMLLLTIAGAAAQAQITVESLLESTVDEVGPQHRDIQDAIEMFQSGDPQGALNALERAKQRNPEIAPPRVMMAKMFFLVNNLQAAGQELDVAIRETPQDPEAYIIQGDLALQQQRLPHANLMYEKGYSLLKNYTENDKRKHHLTVRALSGMGLVANASQDWKTTEDYLRQWLELDADNLIAKERLAHIMFRLGDAQGAYTLYQEVYRESPERIRPEIAMARLYDSISDDKDRAEQLMRRAQERDAGNLRTQVAVAEWALEAGNLELAKLAASTAQMIDKDSLESNLTNALVLMFEDRPDEAVPLFEKAHLLSPSNSVPMNYLAIVMIARENDVDRRRALEYARLNSALYSNYNQRFAREAAITMAWVLHRLDRSQEALQILSRVLEQPGSVESASLYLSAKMLHDLQQDEVASKILDAILDTGKNFVYRDDARRLRQQVAK